MKKTSYLPALSAVPLLIIGCSQHKTVSNTEANSAVFGTAEVIESRESTVPMAMPEAIVVVSPLSMASVNSSSKTASDAMYLGSSVAMDVPRPSPVVVVSTASSESAVSRKAPTFESSVPNIQAQAGVVTAGEWNDLDNWQFWTKLIDDKDYAAKLDYWHIYPKHRVSVVVNDNKHPISNAIIELIKPADKTQNNQSQVEWTARTDNKGSAVLWSHFFDDSKSVDFKDYKIRINGKDMDKTVFAYSQGVMTFDINGDTTKAVTKKADIAFIVDATGSMQDEIDFLNRDLQNVITTVMEESKQLDIQTAAVFYRDIKKYSTEEYVVRKDDFGTLEGTLSFIKKQSASGGGDTPEAVDIALETAINELQWSDEAHARIAFLLLDAPPHHEPDILDSIQQSIKAAAAKGIKIIPITASGIDKDTEFLMRGLAMGTNGTYAFITDDSGVGNTHIAASVGKYDVEKLNALMIRLIRENTDF